MLKQIKEITPLVSQVLEEYPDTRNSDKELILKCWEKEGLFLTEEQILRFRACHSVESYRRCRQKLQEEGKYIADSKIRRQRLVNDAEMRNKLSDRGYIITDPITGERI